MTHIEEQEDEDLEEGQNLNDEQDADYWKAEAEKAKAQAEKYKARFKSEKAKQTSTDSNQTSSITEEMLEAKLAERDFYIQNEQARLYAKEVKEYQSKYNLSPDKAFKLFIAETKPELLQTVPSEV